MKINLGNKAENKEPQLPFRVRIYEKPGLKYGRAVAKFVNEALGHEESDLSVVLGGEHSVSWEGNPPFDRSDLRTTGWPLKEEDLIDRDDYFIFLIDDANLKHPLLVYDQMAICSRHGIYRNTTTEPIYYYVYFLCMGIIGELARLKLGQPFPSFQPRTPAQWSHIMEGGILTNTMNGAKTILRNSEHKIAGLIDNIDKILGDIRDYYDQSDELTSEVEPNTINPPPKDLSLVNNAKKIDLILSDDMPELMGMAWLLQQKIEQATGKRPKTKTYRVSRASLFYATLFKNKDILTALENSGFNHQKYDDQIAYRVRDWLDAEPREDIDVKVDVAKTLEIYKQQFPNRLILDTLTIAYGLIAIGGGIFASQLKDAGCDLVKAKENLAVLIENATAPGHKPQIAKTEQTSKTANAHISKPQFHGGSKTSFSFSESETPVDALGYRRYANALADLITHPDTQTPITIGLAGKWGMGKTTLMRYIGERIDSQQKAKKGNDTASNFILAEFSPWKYSKAEEVWPSLYATVIDKVRETMNWREWQKHQIVIEGRWRYFGWRGLLAVGLVLLIWYLMAWDYGHLPEFFNPTFRKLVVLLIIIIPPLASLAQLTQSVSSAVLKKLKKTSFPLASPIQDEVFKCFDKILDSLGFEVVNTVLNGIGTEKEKEEEDVTGDRQEKEEEDVSEDRQGSEEEDVTEDSQESETDSGTKMIIFVDDLDRCQPKHVLQILESTKILLERKGFVFVLAMDAKVLRYAVGSHYHFMEEKRDDRARIGHDYLEKIIQIPFHLPPLSATELIKLKRQLIGDRLFKPSVTVKPEPVTTGTSTSGPKVPVDDSNPPPVGNPDPPEKRKPVKLDRTISMTLDEIEDKALDDMITGGLQTSPRLMKRIINVYFLCRHLYLIDKDEAEVPPPELMKWIALSTVFPFEACDVSIFVRNNRNNNDAYEWDELRIKGEATGEKPMQIDSQKFRQRLKDNIENPMLLEPFIDITDCFNIALD